MSELPSFLSWFELAASYGEAEQTANGTQLGNNASGYLQVGLHAGGFPRTPRPWSPGV